MCIESYVSLRNKSESDKTPKLWALLPSQGGESAQFFLFSPHGGVSFCCTHMAASLYFSVLTFITLHIHQGFFSSKKNESEALN